MYALVDCNCFYVSCERLFRPDLAGKAVVVLSNNDGCVVARSPEAKALGISMAIPFYQVREHYERGRLHVFSSNYALYGDISERVMTTLETLAPEVEVYSIDEAFLDLTGMQGAGEMTELGQSIKQRIEKWVGIPVGVGIAPTKTLAKLANYAAKHFPKTGGVVDLTQTGWQQRLLAITPIDEIWGVGRRTAAKLKSQGIETAVQLAEANEEMISRRYSIVLGRTVLELRGTPCLTLESQPEPKQQVLCSRTFSSRITDLQPMREAISEYAARAAEKLRREKQLTRHVQVSIRTNPNSKFDAKYANSVGCQLNSPTNDTRVIIRTAQNLLQQIYRPGYRYMKACVVLNDLQPDSSYQADLFSNYQASPQLMKTIDAINQKYLRGVIFAGQGIEQDWSMNRSFLSPCYTTRWKDLRTIKCY